MITSQEAASALKEANVAERRSISAYGYSHAAPHLMLWGVGWMIGYGGTGLFPEHSGWIWLGVLVVGMTGSIYFGARACAGGGAKPLRFDIRIALTWLATVGFFAALAAIMAPLSGKQVGAIIPLIVALGYAVMGAWIGMRLFYAGLFIAVLTLGGYFYLPDHFLLWMAFVGGGSLLLTGFWLRQA